MVIAVDKHKKPVGFVAEKRARELMEARRACIYRYYPTVIILMDKDVRDMVDLPSFRIKIDPGAAHTGMAIVCNETNEVMLYLQIEHRAGQIKSDLLTRHNARRNRRNRETRYRHRKFNKDEGGEDQGKKDKLPPSVQSIVDNIINITKKLMKYINITECSFEAVRFDTQLMDNPDIQGEEYQHGTLFGYEMKEYLMETYKHTCQYCGGVSNDPIMEWEHMRPRSKGGSDSVKNAMLACHRCNSDKGNQTPMEWYDSIKAKKHLTELDKARLECIPKAVEGKDIKGDKRYAAWAGSCRKATERELFAIFGNVECSSGGRTKHNREKVLHLPKDHHYDALCVGQVPDGGYIDRTNGYVTYAKAMGRGNRLRGKLNNCGIIIQKLKPRTKKVFGFMNGDIVRLDKPKGKGAGRYIGRVMVRASGSFDLRTMQKELVTGNHKYFTMLQPADGYNWGTRCAIPLGT